jgi:hypothetical protein
VELGRVSSSMGAPGRVSSHELGGLSYNLTSPLHLIYREKKRTLEKGEVFRLKIIVNLYFMMRGLVKEAEWMAAYDKRRRDSYTRDLVDTLEYIGKGSQSDDSSLVPLSPSNTADNTYPTPSPPAAGGPSNAGDADGFQPDQRVSSVKPNMNENRGPSNFGSASSYRSPYPWGTDGNDPGANSLAEPAQATSNNPRASSMQPPPNGTNGTSSSQGRRTATPSAAGGGTSPSGRRNNRRTRTDPHAVPIESSLNHTPPRSASGRLPTPDCLSSGALRPPSFTPTPVPCDRTTSHQMIDLTSNTFAQHGMHRSLAEDIDDQLERAWVARAQVSHDYKAICKDLDDLAEKKKEHEKEVGLKIYQTKCDHDAKYESKEKELGAKRKVKEERLEAEIQREEEEMEETQRKAEEMKRKVEEMVRKVKKMKAEKKRKMDEEDANADEDLKDLKAQRREEIGNQEREDTEWQDGWETQHNELQRKQHEAKRRVLSSNKKVSELSGRLEVGE